jgi:osmotically-inducible protein OsmY
LAGCSQSDNTTASNDTGRNTNRSENRDLASSSREGSAPNRVYAATNDSNSPKDADNTGRNTRDRSNATLTAGDQGGSDSDREITQRIRRVLSTNDQFSVLAENIKVITVNGKVTLRGPVKTAEEKQAVQSAAESVAGAASVDNQLEVKAQNQ